MSRTDRAVSGPTYIIACSYCGRKFSRKQRDTHLRPHKDKRGYSRPGRTGYLVNTKYYSVIRNTGYRRMLEKRTYQFRIVRDGL